MIFQIILAVVGVALSAPSKPSKPSKEDPKYTFSYSTGQSAQSEIGDPDGSVRGAYTYVDASGAIHYVKYVAGHQIGFKVLEDKVDLTKAKLNASAPLAHEVKLVDGFTPEVAAARSEHLKTFDTIKSLLPNLEEQEDVQIHHLRNEIPATVHRTTVPESVHSSNPPPVKGPHVETRVVHVKRPEPFIDGFSTEDAAEIEAHHAYVEAIRKLLPHLKEEGEIIIPVHSVQHVHHQGNIEAEAPKAVTHFVKITTTPDVHIIEHSNPKIKTVHIPVQKRVIAPVVKVVPQPEKVVKVVPIQKVVDETEEKAREPLASEIELIEGYTPEVWRERQAFLKHYEAIKATLPESEETF